MTTEPTDVPVLEDHDAELEPTELEDTELEDTELESANPNAEAARYRTRLREAEAQNATLTEQVTALQRQLIDGQCAAAGVKPLALWAVAELADLLNEDGTVSAERVHAAIRTAEESLGLRLGLHVPGEGNFPSEPGKPSGRDAWDNAFRPPVTR